MKKTTALTVSKPLSVGDNVGGPPARESERQSLQLASHTGLMQVLLPGTSPGTSTIEC